MPCKQLTDKQAQAWRDIADKLRRASGLVNDAHADLLINLGPDNQKALERIRQAQDSLSGLGYLFTPQNYWSGGPSDNPDNFKPYTPHIAR